MKMDERPMNARYYLLSHVQHIVIGFDKIWQNIPV